MVLQWVTKTAQNIITTQLQSMSDIGEIGVHTCLNKVSRNHINISNDKVTIFKLKFVSINNCLSKSGTQSSSDPPLIKLLSRKEVPATHICPWDNGLQDYGGAGSNAVDERDDDRERSVYGGKCVHRHPGLRWDRLAGVTTDGCPNHPGKNVGLLKRMQDKVTEIDADQKLVFLHCIIHQHVLCKSVLKSNHVIDVVSKIVNFIRARALNHRQFVALLEEHESEHSDIGYHTAVRWLSLGKVLKRVWDLKAEIREFCERKGKDIPELSDEDWIADFAFAVDVTALMNELNTKLQGKGLFVHEMHSLVKAFMRKLQFLSSQLESNTLTHMQTLKEVTPSADHLRRYSSMLGALHGEFSRRFEDLRTIEDEMCMISSPFTCSMDNAPSDVQLELIDLQSDAVLAEHFKSGSLLDFYSSLKEEDFPNLRRHAQKMLVLFGSTYICEQTFSMMKFTKSRYRCALTDDHLSAVLRISTSNIQPDFDALVKAQQRLDFSH
ncbi:general transcription factor II-I repeat domain-containing protein 2B-like [Siniperca chuatsi]|uniref:general transcription factor II-I repeat domain-containing protein 2B-like n=1 Tax=Siniperca chuatsi TaxID=119488 RepID=UPI001CE16141|nr:general transcription factor II-I repeat domain-containing protein 2B-like [Siniperca chuatsi]